MRGASKHVGRITSLEPSSHFEYIHAVYAITYALAWLGFKQIVSAVLWKRTAVGAVLYKGLAKRVGQQALHPQSQNPSLPLADPGPAWPPKPLTLILSTWPGPAQRPSLLSMRSGQTNLSLLLVWRQANPNLHLFWPAPPLHFYWPTPHLCLPIPCFKLADTSFPSMRPFTSKAGKDDAVV